MELKPPVFILLGRYGDIIQLLPAMKAVFDRTGMFPVMIVSHQYANVLEGVSYVTPNIVAYDWWQGVRPAYEYAYSQYGNIHCPQWWHLDKSQAGVVDCPGGFILQSHGIEWGVDLDKWPNYSTSMWDRSGFSVDEMRILPLVFDRRDVPREQLLRSHHLLSNRPNLLVNWTSVSSPFAPVPELLSVIAKFPEFHVVDLGKIRAHRIYDLLGLIDGAAGMITVDTSTLHLAQGSSKPYLAYTVNGWSSSVPRGNVAAEIKYNDALSSNGLTTLENVLSKWLYEYQAHLSRLRSKGSRRVTKEQGRRFNMARPALA